MLFRSVLVLLVLLSGKQPHPLHPSQNDAYLVVASSANLPLMKFLFSVSPTNALNRPIDATHFTPILGRTPQKQLTFVMPVNLEPSSSQFSVPEFDPPPSSARVGWSHSNPESRFLKQQLRDGPGMLRSPWPYLHLFNVHLVQPHQIGRAHV